MNWFFLFVLIAFFPLSSFFMIKEWHKRYSQAKILVFFIDLSIEKIKYNSKKFFSDFQNIEGIQELCILTKQRLFFIYSYLIMSLGLLLISLISLFIINYFEFTSYFFMNFIIFVSGIWVPIYFLLFLFSFLFKRRIFIKILFKFDFFKINNINKNLIIEKTKNKQFITKGLPFIFSTCSFFKRKRTLIFYEGKIKQTLQNKAQSIMYLYIYDIDNFKAPYFVFENQLMIKQYQEIEWTHI
ncbi:Uncharacterised protein [Mycoplasmopsis citelli]|uniref:Transmembrane protein n=1 Tax=Mycoplasmopsis citelli TaxID=171281 RepID=A0A449B249_9BACT|nr:Uncharacterised protein [Mycoplasmopsis citelli]